MSDSPVGRYVKQVAEDFHSARRYAHCRLEAKHLTGRKEAALTEIQVAYLQLGQAAAAAQLGQDLPTYAAVLERKRRQAEAQDILAAKTAATAGSQQTLDDQTQKHTQNIAALEAAYKPLAEAVAAADRQVDATNGQIATCQSDTQKMQAQIQRLVAGELPPESIEEFQARLQEAQQQAKAAELKLNISVSSQRSAKTAADTKAADLTAGQKARQDALAKAQAAVTAAGAKPDNAAAVAAGQPALAAEQQKQDAVVAALQEQLKTAQAAIDVARQQNKTAEQEDQAARQKVDRLAATISAKQLGQKVAQNQATVRTLQQQLAPQQESKAWTAASAAAKAAELAAARQAWQQAQAKCQADLAAARTAQAAADKDVQAARGPLDDAFGDFGRAVYDAAVRDARIDEHVAKASCLRVKADDLTNQITSLQADADRAHTGARRFAWFSVAATVVLAVVIVLIVVLVRGCR